MPQPMQNFLDRVARWWLARRAAVPAPDWREENRERIARLRARGVQIGEGCWVLTENFSTEPYLVQLAYPSHDLRFVQTIGVTSLGDKVYAHFDSLRVRGFRYPIDNIYKMTKEEARELVRQS